MSEMTAVHAPLRIMGIQTRIPVSEARRVLDGMWRRWENGDKASRLPSFTLTTYCVYQYFDDAPEDVLITLGRIVAADLPRPDFAGETYIPEQQYLCYSVPEPDGESVRQTWAAIEADENLPRTFTTDFETYRTDTLPKIYVGVQPDTPQTKIQAA